METGDLFISLLQPQSFPCVCVSGVGLSQYFLPPLPVISWAILDFCLTGKLYPKIYLHKKFEAYDVTFFQRRLTSASADTYLIIIQDHLNLISGTEVIFSEPLRPYGSQSIWSISSSFFSLFSPLGNQPQAQLISL